ncbi:hypothetical protein FOL47_005406 [Perkinsus chesapeaki]|uniref:Uncharacterized protein n=1 Tax=Perkinsus chesapeaki TaxID=330153 RepID=A0A7J6N3I1_PERCH|nr:hypothetical protein FOL47_005406 [Perkinsus chesapeaki]
MPPLRIDSQALKVYSVAPSLRKSSKSLPKEDQLYTTAADIEDEGGRPRVATALRFLLPNSPVNIIEVAWAYKQLPVLLSIGSTSYRRGATAGSLVIDFDNLVEALVRLLNTMSIVSLCFGTGRESVTFVDDCYEYRNWLRGQLGLLEASISCSGHWLAMSVLTHNLRRDLPERVPTLTVLEEFGTSFMQEESA